MITPETTTTRKPSAVRTTTRSLIWTVPPSPTGSAKRDGCRSAPAMARASHRHRQASDKKSGQVWGPPLRVGSPRKWDFPGPYVRRSGVPSPWTKVAAVDRMHRQRKVDRLAGVVGTARTHARTGHTGGLSHWQIGRAHV